jgi:hypothetical protein
MVLKCSAGFTDPVLKVAYYGTLFTEYESPKLYSHLMKFLEMRDLSNFNPTQLLTTTVREDIIKASLSPIDSFLNDHYNEFRSGIPCQMILGMKQMDQELNKIKTRNFELQ